MRRWGRFGAGELVLGSAVLLTGAGCRSSQQQPGLVAVNDSGADPTAANMAPVPDGQGGYLPPGGSTRLMDSAPGEQVVNGRVVNASGRQMTPYTSPTGQSGYVASQSQAAAPVERRTPTTENEAQYAAEHYSPGQQPAYQQQAYQDQAPQDQGYQNQDYQNQGYQDPSAQGDWSDGEQDAYTQVTEEADAPPPPLPVYEQPPAPAPNYLWTPGYWGYAPAGYYWVPGAWIAAPFAGALWTPGYWGIWQHHYGFHHGYWGRYVGFYGGVAYGFGYYGTGYHGGYWQGNNFFYNQAVNRVNVVNIRNVYNRDVVINNRVINETRIDNRVTLNRVSYNGGPGGVQARPTRSEVEAFHAPRVPPMTAQLQNQRTAEANRQQFFRANGGRPAEAAAPRPFAADHVNVPAQRPATGGAMPGQRFTQGVPVGGAGREVAGRFGQTQAVPTRATQGVVRNVAEPGRPEGNAGQRGWDRGLDQGAARAGYHAEQGRAVREAGAPGQVAPEARQISQQPARVQAPVQADRGQEAAQREAAQRTQAESQRQNQPFRQNGVTQQPQQRTGVQQRFDPNEQRRDAQPGRDSGAEQQQRQAAMQQRQAQQQEMMQQRQAQQQSATQQRQAQPTRDFGAEQQQRQAAMQQRQAQQQEMTQQRQAAMQQRQVQQQPRQVQEQPRQAAPPAREQPRPQGGGGNHGGGGERQH